MAECLVKGCDYTAVRRGWCRTHYEKWRKHGDPKGGNTRFSNPLDALAARTRREGDCMLWTGALNRQGYGQMRDGNRMWRVHRWVWVHFRGEIPSGRVIDHVCGNRACVNLEHLRLATPTENARNRHVSNSETGVLNVFKNRNRFAVRINHDGKNRHYGLFETIEEADLVARKMRKQLFGEYAGSFRGPSQQHDPLEDPNTTKPPTGGFSYEENK